MSRIPEPTLVGMLLALLFVLGPMVALGVLIARQYRETVQREARLRRLNDYHQAAGDGRQAAE